MKIGIYTDSHFSRSSSIWNFMDASGYSNRLQTLINSFKWMYEVFESSKVELILNLGDTISSDKLDSMVQSALSEALSSSKGTKEYWLVGNHERLNNQEFHSVALLRHHPNIKVIEDFEEFKFDEFSIILQSYRSSEDMSLVIDHLERNESQKIKTIIGTHQMYKGILPVAGGVSWDDLYKRAPTQLVRIFNGHIHNIFEDGKYCQVGSLISNTFGDNYENGLPGIVTYDTDTDQVTRYSNPYTPIFLTLDYEELIKYKKKETPVLLRIKAGISQKEEILKYISTLGILDYRLLLYNDVLSNSTLDYLDQPKQPPDIYESLKSYLKEVEESLPSSLGEMYSLVDQIKEF